MERSFFVFLALILCMLVLFFAPTVIAFIKFVHCYNHQGFFEAAELGLQDECKLSKEQLHSMIDDIVRRERQKPAPLRFYDYIHALDEHADLEEYTKCETKYRQYDYWVYRVAS